MSAYAQNLFDKNFTFESNQNFHHFNFINCSKVGVICKIDHSLKKSVFSPGSSRNGTKKEFNTEVKAKIRKDNKNFNIYNCKDDQNIVIASEIVLSSDQILKTDLFKYSQAKEIFLFKFDSVKYEGDSLEYYFNLSCKDVYKGKSACFFFFGPSISGKNLMIKENSKLVFQILENMVNSNSEKNNTFSCSDIYSSYNNYNNLTKSTNSIKHFGYEISISYYYVMNNLIVDLTDGTKIDFCLSLNKEIKSKVIKDKTDLNNFFNHSKRIIAYQNEEDLFDKAHFVLIYTLSKIEKTTKRIIAQLSLTQLASSDYIATKETSAITGRNQKSICNTFDNLSKLLINVAVNSSDYQKILIDNLLLFSLSKVIINCSSLFLICNTINSFHSLPSLKFCSRIRDHIVKFFSKINRSHKEFGIKKQSTSETTGKAHIIEIETEIEKIDKKLSKNFVGSKDKFLRFIAENEISIENLLTKAELVDENPDETEKLRKTICEIKIKLEYFKNENLERFQKNEEYEKNRKNFYFTQKLSISDLKGRNSVFTEMMRENLSENFLGQSIVDTNEKIDFQKSCTNFGRSAKDSGISSEKKIWVTSKENNEPTKLERLWNASQPLNQEKVDVYNSDEIQEKQKSLFIKNLECIPNLIDGLPQEFISQFTKRSIKIQKIINNIKNQKQNNDSTSQHLISGYDKLIHTENKQFNSYILKLTEIIKDKTEILDKLQIKYIEEHESLNEKIIELENDNIVLATKCIEYENQKITKQNVITLSPKELNEFENNIKSNEKIEKLDTKSISLHKRLENLKEKFEIEAIEKNEKINNVKILEEKLKDFQTKYDQLKIEKEKSESNLFCLKSINKVLDTKLNESKNINENLNEKLKKNENEFKELKENIQKLNSLIIHKDNEISKLNSKNSDLRHEICLAKKNLDKIDEVTLLTKENLEKEDCEKVVKEICNPNSHNLESAKIINNLTSHMQLSNEKSETLNRNLNELKNGEKNQLISDSSSITKDIESKYVMEIEQLKKENEELYEKIYTNFTFGKINKYSSDSKSSQALVDKRKHHDFKNSNDSNQQKCLSGLKNGSMLQDIKQIISKYNQKKCLLLQKD